MYNNITQPLRLYAQNKPEQKAYIFHHYPSGQVDSRTYKALDERARAIADHLLEHGFEGRRVILLFSPQLSFIDAFFGCLYAGVVPIPLSPPTGDRELAKMAKIISEAEVGAILTASDLYEICRAAVAGFAPISLDVIDVEHLTLSAKPLHFPEITPERLAFIQYTSGSTGNPKGVMVSHANIMHNEQLIQTAFEHDEHTVVAGWLPMFHDMGLIGNVLQPMYLGVLCVLMSPIAFVQKPVRWLQLISQYRATTAGSPNFGYSLCARRVKPEEKAELDLSSWTLAFTGAEPIRKNTIDDFVQAFAQCGFLRNSFYPCYGLAESTLFVTGIQKQSELKTLQLDAEAMFRNQVKPSQSTGSIAILSAGFVRHDVQIKIVDAVTLMALPVDRIGEIWVNSHSNANGYWRNPTLSQDMFAAKIIAADGTLSETPFLRTGDLGFLHEGELYVAGRLKDVIIIRGKNYYPQDVEAAIEVELELSPDSTAAFSVEWNDQEHMVVMIELAEELLNSDHTIKNDINEIVTKTFGIAPYDVWCVHKKQLPRGTSGKLQRFMCRQKYIHTLQAKENII